MREILFRGKRVDNGEWVEGNLFVPDEGHDAPTQICIGTNVVRITYDIVPETVSEFTGLYDRNGKRIFEGDLLKITSTVFGGIIEQQTQKREDIALVEYDSKTGNYRLKVYNNGKYKRISKFTKNHLWGYDAEVIGNKWDNPELLEKL